MPDGGASAYIIAAASIAATAVGTGISYYSQQQQASNASAIANYNAQIAAQNNRVNLAVAQQQAQWQQQSALAQAQAKQNNAVALEQQGRLAEAQAREEGRRMREENERKMATQRARFAKSGVTSEGSPLAIMSESAALLELGVQDLNYKGELEGRSWDRKAELERFDAGFALFDAGIAEYESAAARTGFQIRQRQSAVDRMSGMATAQGYRNAAIGTLVSGAGSALNIGGSYLK